MPKNKKPAIKPVPKPKPKPEPVEQVTNYRYFCDACTFPAFYSSGMVKMRETCQRCGAPVGEIKKENFIPIDYVTARKREKQVKQEIKRLEKLETDKKAKPKTEAKLQKLKAEIKK